VETDSQRSMVVTGAIGGAAAIIGVFLPWVTVSGRPAVYGTEISAFAVIFSVAMAAAVLWLWAGAEPRKVVAFLAPTSLAVVATCISVMARKSQTSFGNGGGDLAGFGVGLIISLAGGLACLVVAVMIANDSLRRASQSEGDGSGAFDDDQRR
jgi:hypothetical protein